MKLNVLKYMVEAFFEFFLKQCQSQFAKCEAFIVPKVLVHCVASESVAHIYTKLLYLCIEYVYKSQTADWGSRTISGLDGCLKFIFLI